MKNRRITLKISLLLTIILIAGLTGCGNSTTTTNSEKTAASAVEKSASGAVKTAIKVACARDITSLDGSGGGYSSTTAAMHIYDCLTRPTTEMDVEEDLATSWEMVDAMTWKFVLREGVTFHDGSVFNAESVKFSIDYYTSMKYKYLAQWGEAWPPECEIVDEYTVLIKTQAPQPAVPRLLSRLPMLPVDFSGMTESAFFSTPVGTGAFKFVSWNQGISLTLEANEAYWEGAPKIKTLTYDTVSDDNARIAAFKTDEYDVVYEVPYDQIETIKGIEGLTVLTENTIGYDSIQVNFSVNESSPVSNIKVRQAMRYAIDAQGICDVIMSGYQSPAEGPAPMNVLGSYDGGGWPARDLNKVKELLQEAGYNGEEIKFVFHTGEFSSDLEISELIVAQLQEAGFNVNFIQVESGAWTDMKKTDGWDISNNSVPGSFTGEAQYHYNQMKSLCGLKLPEFEKIINEANEDVDQSEEERAADITAAMKVLWEDVPYVFGSVPVSSVGIKSDLVGYKYIPLNWLLLAGAGFSD